jgi:hypothetical protein
MAIGTCECCDRTDVPISHATMFGIETFACYLCLVDTNPDPYAELDEPEPYSQLLSSWAECRRLLSEQRNENERLRTLTGREMLEAALKHIDFDGMDPNTFTIAELRRAL